MLLFLLLQVALCTGRVHDKTGPRLMQPYVVDAQTYAPIFGLPPLNKEWIDPTFGVYVQRVTDAVAFTNQDGERRGFINTLYSSMPGWSNDEKYLILYYGRDLDTGGPAHVIHNGQPPFNRIGPLDIRPTNPLDFAPSLLPITPNDIEHVFWSPRPEKADIFYYPSSYSGERRLYQAKVSPDGSLIKKVLHDFSKPPTNCTPTSARGLRFATMYMSYDSREIVGMSCGETCWLYSISEDKVLLQGGACGTSQPSKNAPFPGPSGTRGYFKGRGFAIGPATTSPVNVDIGIKEEHRSIGRNAAGHDIYASVMFDAQAGRPSNTLGVTDMLTGEFRVIIGQSTGWPGPFSTVHHSMVSINNPGWCLTSVVGNPDIRNPEPGHNVLYAANVDTMEVCQLLNVRTFAGVRADSKWSYWSEPHPVGSPSGRFVAYQSDWFNGETVNVFIADMTKHIPGTGLEK